MSKKIELTADQEQYLLDNYQSIFLKDMAAYLQVSMSTMQRLAGQYRLNRYRKKGWKRNRKAESVV